jgi:hypothetical protein
MKIKLCGVILALGTMTFSGAAFANDSAVTGVGGSWHPVKGEHRAVRMVREDININVGLRYSPVLQDQYPAYDVTANFVFHNYGPAQWVQMGFPERGAGDIQPAKAQFKSFQTWVDGKRVPVTRQLLNVPGADEDFTDYKALWVKHVYFKKGETKNVRVKYKSDAGATAGVGWYAPYDFTGANWRSDVTESLMTATLGREFKFIHALFDDKKIYVASRKLSNGSTRYFKRWSNWPAQGPFQLWFDAPKLRD